MVWEYYHHTCIYKCLCVLDYHNVYFQCLSFICQLYVSIVPCKDIELLTPQNVPSLLSNHHPLFPEVTTALNIHWVGLFKNCMQMESYKCSCLYTWLLTLYVHEFDVGCYVCQVFGPVYCWVFYFAFFVLSAMFIGSKYIESCVFVSKSVILYICTYM